MIVCNRIVCLGTTELTKSFSPKFRKLDTCKFRGLLFAVLGVWALCVCSGCNSRSDAVLKVIEHQSIRDEVELATHDEVLGFYREYMNTVVSQGERLCAALESIQDDQSAFAAVKDWQSATPTTPSIQSPLVKNNQVHIEMNDIEFERLTKDFEGIGESMKTQLKAISSRRKNAVTRITNDANISMAARIQINSTMLSLSAMVDRLEELSEQSITLVRRYPSELRATVVMNRIQGCQALGPYLREKTKAGLVSVYEIDSYCLIELSPISDLASLADAVDVGTHRGTDASCRVIEIQLSDADIPRLTAIEDTNREKIMENQRLVVQEQQERERTRKLSTAETYKDSAMKAQQEYADASTKLQEYFQRIDSVPSFRDHIDAISGTIDSLQRAKSEIERSQQSYERQVGEKLEVDLREDELVDKLDQEIQRLQQDYKLRALLSASFGKDVSATEILNDDSPVRRYSNPAEDPKHPDFFAANLVDLSSNWGSNRREALARLKLIDPSEVTDVELRKEIARAIRAIVMQEGAFDQMDAAACLCTWAGKHSVPYLGEMLRQRHSSTDQAALVELIARFPGDESARAISSLVGERSVNEAACMALAKMGSVAEDAVLEITPVADRLQCLSGIQILAEIGTKKSLPLLQKARSSPNREVKEAAKEAARRISAREAQERNREE